MAMQDKEFDELFRSKLDDLHVEPSASVWPGITTGLGAGRRKKILLPFLSIAASVMVLVAAGVLFIPKQIKTVVKQPVQNRISKTAMPKSAAPVNNDTVNPAVPGKVTETALAGNDAKGKPNSKAIKNTPVAPLSPGIPQQIEPVKKDEQPVLAATTQRQPDIITAVVPDNTTAFTVKQPGDETPAFTTKPVIAATQLPVNKEPVDMQVKKRRKIHSFGDLINIVVAKVDKRKDKIIQFTDNDDDDGSNITGVNIGVIKINKSK